MDNKLVDVFTFVIAVVILVFLSKWIWYGIVWAVNTYADLLLVK